MTSSRPLCRITIVVACLCFLACQAPGRAADSAAPKLVIVSAVFGDLDNDKTADVKTKIESLVKDNNLNIFVSGALFGLPPASGARQLKVGYTIDGIYRSKTADDGQVFDISTRLIILKAVYGDLPNGKMDDVTDAVAQRVSKNSLTIPADNETFGDTAPGVVKKLRVDYTLDGVKKSKTVGESETLTIK